MYVKLQQRCEPLFDTHLIWPSVSVNETVELPCPKQEFPNQTAQRTCILRYSCNRPVWSVGDYSRCPDSDAYSDLFLKIAHNRYLELKDQTWEYKILSLSQISYFQSVLVGVIALTVFVLFRKLRNARTRLHMNTLSAVVLQAVMWLLHSFLFDTQIIDGHMYLQVLSALDIDIAPKLAADFVRIAEQMFTRLSAHLSYIIIAGLNRYFETATFFWLLMEGWFLYELICRKPLEMKTSIKRYAMIGWGEKK
ncbi:secretin receptor-like [Copidosoma floridanum]|uniref:secretin receptor-like n=1 Tax=Copidosoma floridanum TaxID=29053 RepID=UPI0006C96E45|nr:secretin receptor-like [Copidosoma floridanum]